VPGRARGTVRPLRVLADRERPNRAVLVGRDLLGDVRNCLEVHVEPHEAGPELRGAVAIEVLVEVVARRIILVPAAPAEPEMLLFRELFSGRELRRRGDRTRVEAGGAHRRQAAGDYQE